eukprot:scaffold1277_cov253-Pinguiococcus_pyrenoidosus.AAC.11
MALACLWSSLSRQPCRAQPSERRWRSARRGRQCGAGAAAHSPLGSHRGWDYSQCAATSAFACLPTRGEWSLVPFRRQRWSRRFFCPAFVKRSAPPPSHGSWPPGCAGLAPSEASLDQRTSESRRGALGA